MISERDRDVIKYRIEQSEEALGDAALLLTKDSYRTVVNRSYYAMFYAVLALLSLGGKETSKHSGAIALFDLDFIKNGRIDKEFSRWLHEVFEERLRSDYSPMVFISRDEAEEALDHARAFVAEVKNFLAESVGPLNSD